MKEIIGKVLDQILEGPSAQTQPQPVFNATSDCSGLPMDWFDFDAFANGDWDMFAEADWMKTPWLAAT